MSRYVNLKVGFDREIFLHQEFGGVSKSFTSVISELRKDPFGQISPVLLFSRSFNHYIREEFPELLKGRSFIRANSGWSTLLTYGVIRELSAQWAGGSRNNHKIDVLHATYYRPSIFDKSKSKKIVVTLHDFIPEKLGWHGVRNPHVGKSSLAKRADLVICVSQATKNDAIERLKLDPEKIRVIHHGVNVDPMVKVKKNIGSNPNVLFVGHRSGYKNFQFLLRALREINLGSQKLSLTLVGPRLSMPEIQELNDFIGVNNWCAMGSVSDDHLSALYRDASVHVVTSRMEGFGMTILESMAQGTPVIVNDISVFREVAQAAGTYFSASSIDSLICAFNELGDSENYEIKSRSSIERASQFTWARTASLHRTAYLDVSN
jgi:glycosyltransferase involved in cell wall biosynthesis